MDGTGLIRVSYRLRYRPWNRTQSYNRKNRPRLYYSDDEGVAVWLARSPFGILLIGTVTVPSYVSEVEGDRGGRLD